MSTNFIFYTYMYLREDGTPYYVGKGKWKRIFTKQHSVGVPVDKSRIIIEPHVSEEEAFEAEKFLISYYGRIDQGTGCLRNRTDGGDGASNPSPETREKMSRNSRNRIVSEETRSKLSQIKKGQKKGPHSEEWKRKVGNTLKGRIFSEETRRKMSEALKGNTRTKGKKQSPEQIRKRVESRKRTLMSLGRTV